MAGKDLNDSESYGHSIIDVSERRRQQARVAQRKYRQRVKQRLHQLELLKTTKLHFISLGQQSPMQNTAHAYSTAAPPPDSLEFTSSAHPSIDPCDALSPATVFPLSDPLETGRVHPLSCNSITSPPPPSINDAFSSTGRSPEHALRNLFAGPGDQPVSHSHEEPAKFCIPSTSLSNTSLLNRPRPPWTVTALHRAAQTGSKPIVQLLIERGADITKADAIGQTALHLAAENGHYEIVKLLLENGADCNCKTLLHRTALHQAVENGHDLVISILLDSSADPSCEDSFGETALHVAVDKGRESIVRVLLDRGADVNA